MLRVSPRLFVAVHVCHRRLSAFTVCEMSAHVQANGDSNEHRGFTLDDAVAVYNLSREASPLGAKVKDALETIDKAIVDYG